MHSGISPVKRPDGFRLFYIAMLIVLTPAYAQAQSNAQLIPKVSPPTPDVASLGRYGTYQVSYFTGLPEINIPLYEIQVGELKVPIAISYHASGIKVTDRASWLGLGWTLQGGGQISRRVLGREDEHGYFTGEMEPQANVTNSTEAGLYYLWDVNRNNVDTEPDIYSYSLPGEGHQGQFAHNIWDNFEPVMIPYNSIKVYRTPLDTKYILTDEKGIEYRLDEVFESTNSGIAMRTAWMLSKMIAPNRQDTIKFNYTSWFGTIFYDNTDIITVIDEVFHTTSNTVYTPTEGVAIERNESTSGDEKKLTEIDYPNGKVIFEALTPRQDGNQNQKELDRILVYNKDPFTGGLVNYRTIEFHQSYFISTEGTSTKRLRLDSLTIKDADDITVQRYKFEYNTSQNLPHFTSKARDYWGYFNNKSNNSLVPRTTITYQPYSTPGSTEITIGSNISNGRNPDPNYMQANVLKTVRHPTGGWTEFTYQTNQYQESGQTKYAGGLRVYQIKSYDGINPNPLLKTIKYGENESGFGRPNFFLDTYFFQRTITRRYFYQGGFSICPELQGTRRDRIFSSSPSIELEPFDGAAVVYPVVTEYNGDETSNTGKTIFIYKDAEDEIIPVPAIGTRVIKSNHYKRGLLEKKETYKKSGPSTYQIVSKTTHTYSAFSDSLKTYVGFKCSKILLTDSNLGSDIALGLPGGCVGVDDVNSYIYGFYYLQTGDNKLTGTTETIYDQNDTTKSVSVTTNYSYGNYNHQLVTGVSTINSKGQTVLKNTKYPHESIGTVYTDMVQKHLFDYPVEETTKLNGVDQEKTTYNYHQFSTHIYRPQTIYRQILSGSNDLEVTFLGYDIKGNPLEYVARDNVNTSFLWAHKNLLPIASVTSATGSQIAYTSFEESSNNQGNWTFTIGSNSSERKTGERSHALNGKSLTKSGLTSVSSYIVSFWAKSGTPSVTNVVASNDAPAAEADGWRYFEKTITGTTSVTISGTGSTLIDEVRLYPAGAKMTTYSFKPGIGVTAVTDPNGVPSYYTYDKFGRLEVIKDTQGKILKTFQYHYKGQN